MLCAVLLTGVAGKCHAAAACSAGLLAGWLAGQRTQHTASHVAHSHSPLPAAIPPQVGQFPNAVNTPAFPSVVLRPGQEYVNQAAWRFTQDRPAKRPSNAE